MTTVFLTGMPEEDAIVARVFPGAPRFTGTDKFTLTTRVPMDATRIVCTGLCGGLVPGYPVDLGVLADVVVDKAGTKSFVDLAWNSRVWHVASAADIALKACRYYSSGLFDESDSVPQRAEVFKRTGAACMDDETRFAAALAHDRKINLNVLRFVSDDYSETLPLAATGAIMNRDGTKNIKYLIGALWARPDQIPMLTKIGMDFKTSLDAMEKTLRAAHDAILS